MWNKGVVNDDVGKLILRLTLGVLILFHGVHKVMNFQATLGWLDPVLAVHHLPSFVAYGVFVGEVIAPILIILGYFTRIGGLLVVINMIFAIMLMHMSIFFTLDGSGGWALQLQAFYLLTGLALVFLGGGKYALNRH
jgi:putative oxidoreductase